MSIRTFAPLAFLFAGLFLAGCDSSGTSPTNNPANPSPGSGHTANGTLKVDGAVALPWPWPLGPQAIPARMRRSN